MDSSSSASCPVKDEGTLPTVKAQQSSAVSNAANAGPNESFLNRLSSNISAYAVACRGATSLTDWMDINNRYLGSSFLYTDEIGTGLIFGYCAGYALNRALKLGALLCGIGFISLQTLNHYGYIKVNWKQVEQDIKKPLDMNGDGKFDHEDIAVIKNSFMRMLAQGLPSTAGLSVGLLYGLRSSR